MRVLVTGAEGMVGKVLVDKLVEDNIDVVASVYPGKTGIFKDIQSEFFKKVEADITGIKSNIMCKIPLVMAVTL